jgi:phosphonate transport system substrate-binding protein
MNRSLVTLALVALLASCTGSKQEDSGVIRMGFTPSESAEKVTANGKVLAELLEKKTGLKFDVFVASDYTALVESMRTNRVQVGWLAPFAFVLAEKTADARVLLKSVRHGAAVTYSAIVVKKDSPYKTIQDLKGKVIAWTDPSSSSGHIIPKSSIIADGIEPDTFFERQIWAGTHESLVLSIMNGQVAAGATYSDNAEGSSGSWTKYEKTMGNDVVPLRALYVTPPMPSDTVSVSAEFATKHADQVEKVKQALLELAGEEAGLTALKNLYGIEGLVVASPEEYEPLRKAAGKIGYEIEDTRKAQAPTATPAAATAPTTEATKTN